VKSKEAERRRQISYINSMKAKQIISYEIEVFLFTVRTLELLALLRNEVFQCFAIQIAGDMKKLRFNLVIK
jgi:hypothetical protein